MQRTSVIQEKWWDLRAEGTWGNAPVGRDVDALRAENDQPRQALAGRAVIDLAHEVRGSAAPDFRRWPRTWRRLGGQAVPGASRPSGERS